jgi:hypothetical protein
MTEHVEQKAISRRTFLRGLAATLGLLAVDCSLQGSEAETNPTGFTDELNNPINATKVAISDAWTNISHGFPEARAELAEVPQKRDSYIKTAGERVLISLGLGYVENGIRLLNPEFGIEWRANHIEHTNRHPLSLIINSGILAPLTEEWLCRYLPSYIGDKYFNTGNQMNWLTGIISAIAFAAPHNLYRDEQGNQKLGQSIPLPFLVSGVYYWYLNRVRGFSHAFFAHSFNNMSKVADVIGYQISRKNGEVK